MRPFIASFLLLLFIAACEPFQEGTDGVVASAPQVSTEVTLGGHILSTPQESSVDDVTYVAVDVDRTDGSDHAFGLYRGVPDALEVHGFEGQSYEIHIWAVRKGQSPGVWTDGKYLLVNEELLPITNELVYGSASTQWTSIGVEDPGDDNTTLHQSLEGYDNPLDLYYGTAILASDDKGLSLSIDMVRNVIAWQIVMPATTKALRIRVLDQQQVIAASVVGSTTTTFRSLPLTDWVSDLEANAAVQLPVVITSIDTIAGEAVHSPVFEQELDFKLLHMKTFSLSSGPGFSLTLEDEPIVAGDSLFIGG